MRNFIMQNRHASTAKWLTLLPQNAPAFATSAPENALLN
jgi:hypothetical protein